VLLLKDKMSSSILTLVYQRCLWHAIREEDNFLVQIYRSYFHNTSCSYLKVEDNVFLERALEKISTNNELPLWAELYKKYLKDYLKK